MMIKFFSRLTIFGLILGSTALLAQAKPAPQAAPAKAPAVVAAPAKPVEKPWYEKVEFSGFVDVNYMYNANNKAGRTPDVTGGLNTYNKQFSVAAVELDIEKVADKESPWGFRVDFQNGQNNPYQETPFNSAAQNNNMNLLQQAYVSFYFDVMKGLTVDVGKMATHIGYEVLESKDNLNYNVGYIFFNTVPFINTGARANLQMTDDWSLGLFLYNSAGGTGIDTAATGTKNAYGDNNTRRKAVGTQLSGTLIEGLLDITWNTLYGIDGASGRQPNAEVWLSEYTGLPLLNKQAGKNDYWLINNVIVELTPTDQLYFAFDYTQGEKSGAAGATFDGSQYTSPQSPTNGLSLFRDDETVKYTYRTYGVWAKYDFTEDFALAARYERIDDSRNGTNLGNYPGAGRIGSNERLDLLNDRYSTQSVGGTAFQNGYRKQYLGSAQTFTITPTYYYGDNIIIKLDLRRDQAKGQQFVNEKGQLSDHQNGATLGIVAKF
ncbi:MAG: hypothetical protein CK427_07645 [Leptospira sp.]|nr:MAG: hypothetical protein CK427_07645 [Leptospira sp.]